MTNEKFKSLTAEEQADFFASLSKDEVKNLSIAQGEAYAKWANPEGEDEDEDENEEAEGNDADKVAAYLKEHKSYPHASIILTSDGVFFNGDVRGKNIAANYAIEKKAEGVTYKEYKIR